MARSSGGQAAEHMAAGRLVPDDLVVAMKTTAPVMEFYERHGVLERIDAGRPIDDVYEDAHRLLTRLSGA